MLLTTGTRAAVRYLNLVGDRYLELADGPGSTRILAPGSQIARDHTAPALDLDLLIGGLKPVTQGLNRPRRQRLDPDTAVTYCRAKANPCSRCWPVRRRSPPHLADNNKSIQQLIDNLNTVVATLSKDGDKFSGTMDRLQRFVSGLSADRDPIGAAIQSLDNGTATLADLLGQRPRPLAGTINELSRLAPHLDLHKDHIDAGTAKANRTTSANWCAWAPTAASTTTTCAACRSASPTSGRHRGVPLDQATDRQVRGQLMLKYRGSRLSSPVSSASS